MPDLIHIVDQSIVMSEQKRLPVSVLGLRGHGTGRVSNFFNALCSQIPDCRYIEFGTFAGRSLAAAAFGNSGSYTGVDKLQWTGSSVRFKSTEKLKQYLASSVALCQGSNVGVVEDDFRLYEPTLDAYDVFFYDADHSLEATKEGIEKMLSRLKPGVVIVDDYLTHASSHGIRKGTAEALSRASVKKTWVLEGGKGWHTGLFVAVVG